MRYIKKSIANEPRELKEHRSGLGATYDNYNDKARLSELEEERLKKMPQAERTAFLESRDKPLKKAILKDQGYICCYCMSRIQLNSMAVEHYIAQSRHENSPFDTQYHRSMELNYSNLLGSCKYSPTNPRDCSGIRGDEPLKVDPRNSTVEQLVRYKKSGKVFSEDPRIDHDLNMVLRLNPLTNHGGEINPADPAINLNNNRLSAVDEARRRMLTLGPEKNWPRKEIESEIKYWLAETNGQFRPYCMAAVHYLRSKIQKAQ